MNNIRAIIPAAGKPRNQVMLNNNLPDAMNSINGKPIIGYIIEDLLERKISNIHLVISDKDTVTANYVVKMFGKKCKLKLHINCNQEKGVGHSLSLGAKEIRDDEEILIYLGDTLYKGKFKFTKDFLIVSDKYEEPNRWCFVKKNKKDLVFIDKPQVYKEKNKILCGLYYFKDGPHFRSIIEDLQNSSKFEIKSILEDYQKKHTFQLINANRWYDCGNIDNYYKARIDFLKLRSFNTIKYNDLYGYITKTSEKKEKILNEINWYLSIPQKLSILSPRLVKHSLNSNKPSYSLEYYGYQSLADLFVFKLLNKKVWFMIIDRLFVIIKLFGKHKKLLSYEQYFEMYVTKTMRRIEETKKTNSNYWEKLFAQESLEINGNKYKGLPILLKKLREAVDKLYEIEQMTIIHGDLCMSNILFDPHSKIFKLIDPRGSFGKQSIYGDQKYDIAKLRHSFCGYYDFILSDLASLEENENSFWYESGTDSYHADISQHFDKVLVKNNFNLKHVMYIEGLLFLSMLPIHSDNFSRQKKMFLTGIVLLNKASL